MRHVDVCTRPSAVVNLEVCGGIVGSHPQEHGSELVEEFDNVVLQDDEMLVSYDVKSLFTSLLVGESIDICERRLRDDD